MGDRAAFAELEDARVADDLREAQRTHEAELADFDHRLGFATFKINGAPSSRAERTRTLAQARMCPQCTWLGAESEYAEHRRSHVAPTPCPSGGTSVLS